MITPLQRLVLGLFACVASVAAHAAEGSTDDLVLVRSGTLPIILTVPHGGRLNIPNVPPRTAPDAAHEAAFAKWGGFRPGGDPNTDALALRMAAEIERMTGHAPYVVLARVNRKFVDVNRPAELAYADPAAAPYYARYHESIRTFIDEIHRKYPAGVLLDVHGEKKDRDVLMRGTSNGRTVSKLLRRAGAGSITGSKGLFGQLETQGFKVFPSNDLPVGDGSEDGGFNGGYTVNFYGSQRATGIDAIQLEFGTNLRRDDELDRSAAQAARAIVTFYKAYVETPARRRR